jgi:hypothetical protein
MFFWDHWLQWFNHWLLAATASEVMAASETELLDDTRQPPARKVYAPSYAPF